MASVMRPRRDGGYSLCSSPDELIGKGRCCHVLGDEKCPSLNVTSIQRGMYEVDMDGNGKVSIQGDQESIKRFFDSMAKLDDEKVRKILNFLEGED